MNAHHGRTHSDASDLSLKFALDLTGKVGHVCRGPSHVEADNFVKSRGLPGSHHPYDPSGRAGQNRILALEARGLRESAVRLHERQTNARHLGGDLANISF